MEKELVISKQIECDQVMHNKPFAYYVRGFWVWHNFTDFRNL